MDKRRKIFNIAILVIFFVFYIRNVSQRDIRKWCKLSDKIPPTNNQTLSSQDRRILFNFFGYIATAGKNSSAQFYLPLRVLTIEDFNHRYKVDALCALILFNKPPHSSAILATNSLLQLESITVKNLSIDGIDARAVCKIKLNKHSGLTFNSDGYVCNKRQKFECVDEQSGTKTVELIIERMRVEINRDTARLDSKEFDDSKRPFKCAD